MSTGADARWSGRRVVVTSLYYAPEHTGSAPYTTELAEHLAELGARVQVVTTHPHYPAWRRPDDVDNAYTTESRGGVLVHRVPAYIPTHPTLARRLGYESSFVLAGLPRLRHARPDLVIGCSPGLFAAGLAAGLAARTDAPLVHWVQDVVSSAASQAGLATTGRLEQALEQMEGRILGRADRVVVASEAFVPALQRLIGDADRLRVLRNWSRLPAGEGIDASALRRRLGWSDRTVVLHTGNIGQKQGLDELAPSLQHLAAVRPDLHWAFSGDGNRRREFEDAVAGLPNVEIFDPVSDDEYLPLLRAADVLLVHERSTVRDMSLPSKLTSYFAAHRPVVAVTQSGGSTASEVERSGGGLVVPHGDTAALEHAVDRVAASPEGRRLADAGLAYYRQNLSAASRLEEFGDLLAELLPAPSTGRPRSVIDLRDDAAVRRRVVDVTDRLARERSG